MEVRVVLLVGKRWRIAGHDHDQKAPRLELAGEPPQLLKRILDMLEGMARDDGIGGQISRQLIGCRVHLDAVLACVSAGMRIDLYSDPPRRAELVQEEAATAAEV